MEKSAGPTCFLVREACEGERVAGGRRRWARCGQHRQAERSRPCAQRTGFSATLLYFKAAIRTPPAPVHRCARGGCRRAGDDKRNSGIGLTGCGHGVVEAQLTGLPCANAHGALARAPQRSCRTMRRVCERGLNGGAEIELTIAVRVGAGELEEGPRRRMQYV